MPNIPPLISSMPDAQSLYAPYQDTIPTAQPFQNFVNTPVPCTGSGALAVATITTLFTGVAPYNFGSETFYRLIFADAAFSYTATAATGTIDFSLLVGGSVLQTITSTPSLSAQVIAFTQASTLLPAVTGNGTLEVSITATSTDANTITTTNSQSLYCAIIGCLRP